jgi:hypothetical protein
MYEEIIKPLDFLLGVFEENFADIELFINDFVETNYGDQPYDVLEKLRKHLQTQVDDFTIRLKETREKFLENLEDLDPNMFERGLSHAFQPLGMLKDNVNLELFLGGIANISSDPSQFKELIYKTQYFF